MTLQPLLAAPMVVQIHAFAAIAALCLGAVQFLRRKGGKGHRIVGWAWSALMAGVAFTSLFINDIRHFGPWSLIHLLSLVVLIFLPIALHAARAGNRVRHRNFMIGLFVGALIVAGAFTFMPGRVMHQIVVGG